MGAFKRFKTHMDESRRNPESNPKISAYEALLPYYRNPDIYISLTDIDKLGINPQSRYNTPLGIYTYPLADAWTLYEIGKNRSLKDVPFAADRPYIWIVKAKRHDGFVNDMYMDYGSDSYDTDVRTLEKIFNKYSPIKKSFVSYDHDSEVQSAQVHIEQFQDVVDEMNPDPNDAAQMKVYNGFVTKLKRWQEELASLEKQYILTFDELERVALDTTKVKNSIMSFWNLSRLLANRICNEESPGIKSATMWNSILRQCGYSGFADKSGRGYIHPSEPMQAVFLTRDAFTVVDKVRNKNYIKLDENVTTIARLVEMIDDGVMTLKQAVMLLDKAEEFDGKMTYMKKYEINVTAMTENPNPNAVKHLLVMCSHAEWTQSGKQMVMGVWERFYVRGLFNKCGSMGLALENLYKRLPGNIGHLPDDMN